MINKDCWKQPTPVDIYDSQLNALERAVFLEIFLRAQRNADTVLVTHGNKRLKIYLKRGQCLFSISDFALSMDLSRNKIRNAIKTCSETYSEMDIETKPYGLIVTVLDYDELSKMNNETYSETNNKKAAKGHRKDSERTSLYMNKTVETDKTVKTEKKETADKPPSFPSDSKEYKYAQRFFERLQEINPTIKKPNLSRWAADFDLLLRVDKRDEQQLGKVVSYALTGFWRGKIMSPKKLREKYDTLTTQMLTDTDKQGKPTAAGLAAGDTELEVRTTLTGREYVVTKDTPESFIPPEYMQKFRLMPSEWQKKTDDGSLFFFLKDWYKKNGKGTTDFEIKYCNTPTHD